MHSILPFSQVALRLSTQDDVAIAKRTLEAGAVLDLVGMEGVPARITVRQSIPGGHKIALGAIAAGDAVRRYGQVIGFATQAIRPGEHVHVHNLGLQSVDREYAFGVDAQPVEGAPEEERRFFAGYERADGRVGTRNYVAVLSTVNCSAHVTGEIARYFTPQRMAAYPNVDGVIALTHHSGCSVRAGGPDYVLLQRTLAGMACHPNVGGTVFVGLGCETNQVGDLFARYGLAGPQLVIQDVGGVRKTVRAGIDAVQEVLARANDVRRTAQPLSTLTLALQCGGSDSWSGVTANPLLGRVSDRVVRQGGTVVLAETPEIYGAEQLLTRRAVSEKVGRKLLTRVRWWEEHTRRLGMELDNNRSPGNQAGGLTTIYEKSLGAIAKAGSTPLTDVYEYAQPVKGSGFVFMDTPGNDWIAVTGQVAGGCTLVLFTTGRGSVFGFKPSPCIKISTHSDLYARMVDDMDLDAGRVLAGEDVDDLAGELLDFVIDVASGQSSKSEAQGIGEAEFCPWSLGGIV